jgi:hypothetical protein
VRKIFGRHQFSISELDNGIGIGMGFGIGLGFGRGHGFGFPRVFFSVIFCLSL